MLWLLAALVERRADQPAPKNSLLSKGQRFPARLVRRGGRRASLKTSTTNTPHGYIVLLLKKVLVSLKNHLQFASIGAKDSKQGGWSMPYRIRSGEFIMEADSYDEFRSILIMLGIIPGTRPPKILRGSITPKTPPPAPKSEGITLPSASLDEKLEKFYQRILINSNSSMFRTIKTLQANPSGLADAKLRESLGLHGQGLGGTMAGLSKKAELCGLSLYLDVLLKEDEGGSLRYRLTDSMRKLIETREKTKQGIIY